MNADTPSYQWDFFLAHAGPDVAEAESLYDLLAPHARVFLDSKCLEFGDVWSTVLPKHQERSYITVVLISDKSDAAWYQQEEIAAAIDLARRDGRRVVPVYLRGFPKDHLGVPYGLRIVHGAQVRGDADRVKLVTGLCKLLGKTVTVTPSNQPAPPSPGPAPAPPQPIPTLAPQGKVVVLAANNALPYFNTLSDHLILAIRRHEVHLWQPEPGDSVEYTSEQMNQAALIVLLVNPRLFVERQALIDHALTVKGARVVPVLLTAVDLKGSQLADLVALPRGGKPVVDWRDQDTVWAEIAKEIRALVEANRSP